MKYTTEQIEKMRGLLANRDIEQSDDGTLFDVFMEGCPGWNNFTNDFVVDQFKEYFDDEDLE